MKINDLELRTGLDRATIRYYEKEGMITPIRRENGYRDYSEEDKAQLMKIKLLQQLGMPLSKIRELQQGSADLQKAIAEQIIMLNQQRDNAQRSAQVCMLMQTDGVTYTNLNADYYLKHLATTPVTYPQSVSKPVQPSFVFREKLERPHHPFRHLFARVADLLIFSLALIFLQAIVLRLGLYTMLINPISPFVGLAFVPVEALCCCLFATTPGKLLFGIQIRHEDGCKHSFSTAISRAFRAYRFGWGWGIPIWRLWRLIRSYGDYEKDEIEWNDESEVTYLDWSWKQIVAWVLIIVLSVGGIYLSNHMINLPKNAGTELNIEQFVENYNDYWIRHGNEAEWGLNPDGKFMKLKHDDYTIVVGGDRTFDHFTYDIQDNVVRGVSYEEKLSDITLFVSVIPTRGYVAAIALLAAQEGEDTDSLTEFSNTLSKKIESALQSKDDQVEFQYGNLLIKWYIKYENCRPIGTQLYHSDEFQEPGSATIQFSVSLTDK